MYMQCWMESRQAVYIIVYYWVSVFLHRKKSVYFAHAQWVIYRTLRIEKSVLRQAYLKKQKVCFKKSIYLCIPIYHQYQFHEGDIF